MESAVVTVNFVNHGGRNEQRRVNLSQSVRDFKAVLAAQLPFLNGRERDIALTCNGIALLEPERSLQDYSITNDSYIEVSFVVAAPYDCPKCSLAFLSNDTRVPYSLQCGHAICRSCVQEEMAAVHSDDSISNFLPIEIFCAKCGTKTIWSKEKSIESDEKKTKLMVELRRENDLAIQERNLNWPQCVGCGCESAYRCLDCPPAKSNFCSPNCNLEVHPGVHTEKHKVINSNLKCVPCGKRENIVTPFAPLARTYCMECGFVCTDCHTNCNNLCHKVEQLNVAMAMFVEPVEEKLNVIGVSRAVLLDLSEGLRNAVDGLCQQTAARLAEADSYFEELKQNAKLAIHNHFKECRNTLLESLDETGAQLSALDTAQCALEHYSNDPTNLSATEKGFNYLFNVEVHRDSKKDLVAKHLGNCFELALEGDQFVVTTRIPKKYHWAELILFCATLLLLIIGRLSYPYCHSVSWNGATVAVSVKPAGGFVSFPGANVH